MTHTAGQQRLITYHALLFGVKGHIYYYPESLDDQGIARNRLDDLVIVWCEVGLVENILACREPPMPLRTSDASMDAAQIDGGGESAVLLVKDQRHYNRYVDQATVEGLRVELPDGRLPNSAAYQLAWPHAEGLPIQGSADTPYLLVPRFALTSLLLLTTDSVHAEAIERTIERDRTFLNLYFSLPNYLYITRGGPRVAPGDLRRRILEAQGENVWPSIDRAAQ